MRTIEELYDYLKRHAQQWDETFAKVGGTATMAGAKANGAAIALRGAISFADGAPDPTLQPKPAPTSNAADAASTATATKRIHPL